MTNVLAIKQTNSFSEMSIEHLAEELKKLRDLHGINFTEISRQIGTSRESISQLANQKKLTKGLETKVRQFLVAFYGSDSSNLEPVIASYKQEIELFEIEEFIDTLGFIDDMRKRRKMGVIVGHPGSGKTTALKEYVKRTPNAIYIEAFSSMRMNDLLDIIAKACGTVLPKGTGYKKLQHVISALRDKEIMFLIDEAEFLKKWDVSKFEDLRKIWDNTGTPIILCGTYELEEILTRGNGRDNLAQIYRRKFEIKLKGVREKEAREKILSHYNVTKEAADLLVAVAIDVKHGGMGNFVEILELCLEEAQGGQIDGGIVKDAKHYKMLY